MLKIESPLRVLPRLLTELQKEIGKKGLMKRQQTILRSLLLSLNRSDCHSRSTNAKPRSHYTKKKKGNWLLHHYLYLKMYQIRVIT